MNVKRKYFLKNNYADIFFIEVNVKSWNHLFYGLSLLSLLLCYNKVFVISAACSSNASQILFLFK